MALTLGCQNGGTTRSLWDEGRQHHIVVFDGILEPCGTVHLRRLYPNLPAGDELIKDVRVAKEYIEVGIRFGRQPGKFSREREDDSAQGFQKEGPYVVAPRNRDESWSNTGTS
ncbi:hypothetical protein QSH57_011353 [Fusarium oxysporum f. sp. vasinfectum]|nr:hypothetical protein QSH57_011353 [Fusarium oxysporum f. sp. vasinfectum]